MTSILKMAFASLFALVAVSTASASDLQYAASNPTMDAVNAARVKVDGLVWSMKGITSIGITACETKTGTAFYKLSEAEIETSLFESCLNIGFETEEQAAALRVLFPLGHRVDGVLVSIEATGVFVLEAQ